MCCAGLVGAGLPAMGELRSVRQRAGMSSPASRLPQVLGHSPGFVCCAGLVGAGLPAMEPLRFIRQSAGMSSPASRLPQVLGHSPGFMCCAGLVGAGLPAMGQLRSVRQSAGMSSPASRLPQVLGHSPGFVCCAGLVGAGLPAMEQLRSVRQRAGMSSPVSRLPQVLGHSPGFMCCAGLVGAGLPAMGQLRFIRQSAGMSSAPTGIGSQPGIYVLRGPCGSWLASDGGVAVCQAARRDVIGSHRYWVTARDLCAARALWELACQRWGSCGLSGSAQGCHRLPQVLGHSPGFMCCAGLVGAGLPAMGQVRFIRQSAAGQLAHGSRAG